MGKAVAIAASASAAHRVRWVMVGMLMTLLAALSQSAWSQAPSARPSGAEVPYPQYGGHGPDRGGMHGGGERHGMGGMHHGMGGMHHGMGEPRNIMPPPPIPWCIPPMPW